MNGIVGFSIILILFICTFFGVSYVKFNLWDEHLQTQQFYDHKVVSMFNEKVDDEWIPILKYGKIISCVPFDAFDAYADKFIVEFDGGYKGMFKLMEKPSLFDRAIRTVHWNMFVLIIINLYILLIV